MELKNRKINSFLIIILSAVVCGCSFFDQKINEKGVINENFKIVNDPNDLEAKYELVLNYSNDYFEVIEKRCQEIYFDSSNIYVKSFKNNLDTAFIYRHIVILDSITFKKVELNKKDYQILTNKCSKCVQRTYY